MYQPSVLQSMRDHERDSGRFTHALDFSNYTVSPADQFEAYRAALRGVVDVSFAGNDLRTFPADLKVWNLGKLAFMRTRLPGPRGTHLQRHLKNGQLDHWYVSMPCRRSEPDGPYRDPAAPELHCLATPLDTTIGHGGALTLFLPHDLFTSTAGLYRMLDLTFEGGLGRLLADYLLILDRSLPDLQRAEIPYVVEATRSLIAVCLAPSRRRLLDAQAPVDATLMGRARRMIDERLEEPGLSTPVLCAALGVSRSRLYRIFEPLGGVASYIRRQRLLRTRDALSDGADTRSISRIAEQWGFMDASAYSRTFRQEFGISPREARDMGWASDGFVVAQQSRAAGDAPRTLYQLLRAVDLN